ncbi:MAG: hypothetical protein KDA71_20755, partial [Planctomycetales bacterium]|nr:hypothetical protein [Planctomycetales bacterium]
MENNRRHFVNARELIRTVRERTLVGRPNPMTEVGKFRGQIEHLVLILNRSQRRESIGDVGAHADHGYGGTAFGAFGLTARNDVP